MNFEKLISVVEKKLEKQRMEEALTIEKIVALVEARTKKLLQGSGQSR